MKNVDKGKEIYLTIFTYFTHLQISREIQNEGTNFSC